MANTTANSSIPCLVCNKLVVGTDNDNQSLSSSSFYFEDKRITLFLLRNVLEISKPFIITGDESRENCEQCRINICSRFLVTCESCKKSIKEASLIYSEIRELAQKFRGIQKETVEALKKCSAIYTPGVENDDVEYCRKLVKDCDYNGFGFPFIVQDYEDDDELVGSPTIDVSGLAVDVRQEDGGGERKSEPVEVVVKQEEDSGDQQILLIFPEDDEEEDNCNDQVDPEEEDVEDEGSNYDSSQMDSAEEDDDDDDNLDSPENLEDEEDLDLNPAQVLEKDNDIDIVEEENHKTSCSKPENTNLLSSFICKKCLQRFPTNEELDQHHNTVHLKEKRAYIPCPLEDCTGMYTSSSKLSQHFRLYHLKPPFICKDCKKEFSSPKQTQIHHNQTHLPLQKSIQPEKIKPVKVKPVKVKPERSKPQKIKRSKKLRSPPEKSLQTRSRGRPRKPRQDQDLQKKRTDNPFPCPLCRRSLTKFNSLVMHMKKYHPNHTIPLHELGLRFHTPAPTEPALPEERKSTNPKPKRKYIGISTFELQYPHIKCKRNSEGKYPCPWTDDDDPTPCPRIFRMKSQVQRHIKVHHLNIPLFTCTWSGGGEGKPICGKTFNSRHNYVEHYDEHRGTPKYKCEHCGMTFYRGNPFVRHQQKMHSKEKFICEICGREYSCQEYLNVHRTMSHKGKPNSNKPPMKRDKTGEEGGAGIICEFCGQLLKNQATLKVHVETKHDKIPGKHCCHLCDNRYRVVTHLNKHLWIMHQIKVEGYHYQPNDKIASKGRVQCQVKGCKMRFSNDQNFQKHWNLVHGEDGKKPGQWNCKYCGKNFFHKIKWQHCEKTHENKETRPEKCEVCGKGFPTKHHLRFHQKHTHKMQLPSFKGQRPKTVI